MMFRISGLLYKTHHFLNSPRSKSCQKFIFSKSQFFVKLLENYWKSLKLLDFLILIKQKFYECLIGFDGTHCDGATLNTGEQMPVTTIFLVKIHIWKCTYCLKINYTKKYNDAGGDGLCWYFDGACLDIKIKQRV